MEEGYYISTFLSFGELQNILKIKVRHDHTIALWSYFGDEIKLVKYWELERITGIKQHQIAAYSKDSLLELINKLLKENKTVFISLIFGMLVKVLLNIPLIHSFNKMGLPAFYGAITATILGFLTSSVIALIVLRKKYKFNLEETAKESLNILIAVIAMVIVLLGLKLVVPINTTSRLMAILVVALYAVVGAAVYLFILHKTKSINNIFGEEKINELLSRKKKTKNIKPKKVVKNKIQKKKKVN